MTSGASATAAGHFDAIVVGSGASGGMAAKELTEKGLKVLVLERGHVVEHGTDYTGEDKAPWEFKFRGLNDRQDVIARQPIQSTSVSFEEGSSQFFIDDRDHPYDNDRAHPFNWIRGHQTGGRSVTWGRATPRLSAINFEENLRDGHGVDWPIRYDDLAPWYSHAERYIGVSGFVANNPNVPDGEFLPPMPLNCVEKHVHEAISAKWPKRMMIPERSSCITAEHRGRPACHYCGPCYRGCSTASYYSSLSVSLPDAKATGRLTLVHNAIVCGIDYDPVRKRVTGVRVIDAKTRERRTYTARLLFLNASSIASAQILLMSKSEAFPNGLANASDQVGRNLMDHVFGVGVTAQFAGFEDERPIGNRPIQAYIPRFRNVDGDTAPFVRGYAFQGRAWRTIWNRGEETPLVGAALKADLRRAGPWMLRLGLQGECLPLPTNRVTLHPTKVDPWGLPQVSIAFQRSANDMAIAKDAAEQAAAMLKAAGGEIIYYRDVPDPAGLSVHEQGTARMGRDPHTSVLNGHNQAHDIDNLFLTDGAGMASSGCANPTLTYLAFTARAADYAVKQMAVHAL